MQLTLDDIAVITGGRLYGNNTVIAGICTDTRTLEAGQLFVALRGAHFDGDTFVTQAWQGGAAAAIVHQHQPMVALPQIVVSDTRMAFAALARHYRRSSHAKVIALTGSNGKTTTKELLYRLLATQGKVLATQGNLNNDIGVPLTLLRLQGDEDFAVIEMGANHEGEIAVLTAIVEPDLVLVTNVSASHLEGFGSLDGVIRAKGELYAGSGTAGIVLNQDLDCAAGWQEQYKTRVLRTFGLCGRAEVTATDIAGDGSKFVLHYGDTAAQVEWQLAGRHNVANALAAFAAASVYGVSVYDAGDAWRGLRLTQGRLAAYQCGQHTIYDDTYNANPASFRAGIDVIAVADTSLVLAGAMGELGEHAEGLHHDVVAYAREHGIAGFWCVGESARLYGDEDGFIRHFDDAATAATALQVWLADTPSGAVLVKGSRSARMERVIGLAGIDSSGK